MQLIYLEKRERLMTQELSLKEHVFQGMALSMVKSFAKVKCIQNIQFMHHISHK
jgi:hypothetical protein